jgi:hypothetical protein
MPYHIYILITMYTLSYSRTGSQLNITCESVCSLSVEQEFLLLNFNVTFQSLSSDH